ncbi:hypothetical protein EXIGLDRAFT_847371 [Exidia glandulosa HHB12029]|uniref:Autophagy-related protein 17 n=1 Tax=Exidia glandulosa HHB12029 TaxID=1314781 RepID=A0A166MZT5_EXIGL|nr:hypothetical protein EXIGLDRAFT_847371 [Exidia glandulosa HHB12029]
MQDSARVAVDVVALHAKVRWMVDGVLEQFKLASQVAKTLGEQRMRVIQEAKEWDALRAQYVMALDQVLDACGAQVVPSSFWHVSPSADDADDDVFLLEPNGIHEDAGAGSSTLKTNGKRKVMTKTLRDFIDENAIEDANDKIDDERNRLDDLLASTAHAQYALEAHVTAASGELVDATDSPSAVLDLLRDEQKKASDAMANHLHGIMAHLQQVEHAVRDEDAAPQDIDLLVRDTDELPLILAEIQDFAKQIAAVHPQFVTLRRVEEDRLHAISHTIHALETLETLMDETLAHQDQVESDARDILGGLHAHLETLDALRSTYASYRLAYSKLVLELDRRARYSAAAEQLLLGALQTLDTMRDEEERDRALFFAEQGGYLPDDLCLFVGNPPPRTEISIGPREDLPALKEELIAEVRGLAPVLSRRNVDLLEGRL